MSFWKEVKKPIFTLAPMADVTDFAFREMFAKYGEPDIFWTEFVSADGLISSGRDVVIRDLEYSEKQRPIVAQLFTSKPESMRKGAELVKELGFDGVDINMGCPDKNVEKQGCGANLIKNPSLARELIEVSDVGLPVSVKTRLGYSKIDMEWMETLLNSKISALTIHLRTRKEMSKVDAHWEVMRDIVSLRDKINPEVLIIGNGDIASLEDGDKKIEETGCDGVMIGRGAFGNPWFFNREKKDVSMKEKLEVLVEHSKLFDKKVSDIKSFHVMKKHFKAYVRDFDGAGDLREALMKTEDSKGVERVVNEFLNKVS